jgi:hypothetical protein
LRNPDISIPTKAYRKISKKQRFSRQYLHQEMFLGSQEAVNTRYQSGSNGSMVTPKKGISVLKEQRELMGWLLVETGEG